MEGYKTIKELCSAETEVKHSRFIATVCPCKTEREATDFIASMRKKYWDAKHNVYAFSVRENGTKRFSDDGEPHSTAGLPVMEVINHSGITDIAVVVIDGVLGISEHDISAAFCSERADLCVPIQKRQGLHSKLQRLLQFCPLKPLKLNAITVIMTRF